MFGAALDFAIQWRVAGLSSSGQRDSNDTTGLVMDVYRYFRDGIRAGLGMWDEKRLSAFEAGVPWARRLFFWEGYAFGLCALHACLGRRGNPLAHSRAPGFRFMFWTGMGFWNGAASPFPRVSLDPKMWAEVPEFEDEYPLILGGSSFAIIAQDAAIDRGRLEAIPGIRNAADVDGVYFGVGRALWFLYTRNPAKLTAALEAHPDHAMAIARGLGVAITLTQLAMPERVFEEIATLPRVYWPELITGSMMAVTCLLLDDPRAAEPLSRFPAPLDGLIAEAHANLPSFTGRGWTERFSEACVSHAALWDGLRPPARIRKKSIESVVVQ